MRNAPDIPAERFNALTRLDHNRAKAQLAAKAGASVNDVTHMTIWGNHSATQYPDLFNALVRGQNAAELIDDQEWLESTFLPTVQQRGAAIIEARGASSAASAANATVEHMRDWVRGTPEGDWVSMSVPSDGSYGMPEGLISSFACTISGGAYQIVPGLKVNDFSRGKIDASVARAGRGARRGPGAGSYRLNEHVRFGTTATLVAMSESQPPNPFSREASEPSDGLGAIRTPGLQRPRPTSRPVRVARYSRAADWPSYPASDPYGRSYADPYADARRLLQQPKRQLEVRRTRTWLHAAGPTPPYGDPSLAPHELRTASRLRQHSL